MYYVQNVILHRTVELRALPHFGRMSRRLRRWRRYNTCVYFMPRFVMVSTYVHVLIS